MNKITFPFLMVISMVLYFTSCADVTVTKTTDYASLSAVTGLNLADESGAPIGTWNSPNNKTGNAAVYPIPGNGNVSIFSSECLTKIWITPASCVIDTVNQNIPSLSQSIEIDLDEVEDLALEEYDASGNIFQLDLSNLGQGFYKIFYQIGPNEEIFWTNYYIDPNFSNVPDIDLLDMQCN